MQSAADVRGELKVDRRGWQPRRCACAGRGAKKETRATRLDGDGGDGNCGLAFGHWLHSAGTHAATSCYVRPSLPRRSVLLSHSALLSRRMEAS